MNAIKNSLPQPIQHGLRQLRTAAFFVQYDWQALRETIHPNPIFILGNQKSGTSAIAALLAAMTGRSAAIDLSKEVKHPTYHQILHGRLAFDQFVQRHKLEFSKDIVKEPNLTLLYPELVNYFPNAPVVFVLRDPRDNIRSILNRLKLPGHFSHLPSSEFNQLSSTWQLILSNDGLNLSEGNYVEQLALRWNRMADIYLNHADRVLLIRYEDFLADKVGVLSQLAQDLQLTPQYDVGDRLDVQFQPRGDRTVNWHDFFGAENLARIEQICGSQMKALNYAFSEESRWVVEEAH